MVMTCIVCVCELCSSLAIAHDPEGVVSSSIGPVLAGGPIHGLIKIATDHRLGIPSQCFAAAKAGIGKSSQVRVLVPAPADQSWQLTLPASHCCLCTSTKLTYTAQYVA